MPAGRRQHVRSEASRPRRGAWAAIREELTFMTRGAAAVAGFLFNGRGAQPVETVDPDAPAPRSRRSRRRKRDE